MTVHKSVLLDEILDFLNPKNFLEVLDGREKTSDSPLAIIDCTFGGGGHTHSLIEVWSQYLASGDVQILGLDQDSKAIEAGNSRYSAEIKKGWVKLIRTEFSNINNIAAHNSLLGIIADLGFSSDQIEDSERGLSFHHDGPLDMRLNPDQGKSLAEVLETIDEGELERALKEYGEERFSKGIARSIIRLREDGKLPQTTKELVQAIVIGTPPPYRRSKIHVATRSFQALRIMINDEMGQLDSLLGNGIISLVPGGRMVVISFHSLEDRRVKWAFRNSEEMQVLTKKPITASELELDENPRARSAKLRVAMKI